MKKLKFTIRAKTICRLRAMVFLVFLAVFVGAFCVYAADDFYWSQTANYAMDPAIAEGMTFEGELEGDVVERFAIPSLDIGTLDIVWKSGDFAVFPSPDQSIYIIEKSKGVPLASARLQYAINDKALKLADGRRKPVPFSFFPSVRVNCELYLPAKIYNNITLSGNNGTYSASGVVCEKLTMDVNAGYVKMSDIKASEINLKSDSAIITLADGVADKLTAKLLSGRATIGGDYKDVSLSASSGSVRAELTTAPEALEAAATSGTFDITLPQPNCTVKFTRDAGKITVNGEPVSNTASGSVKCGKGGKNYKLSVVTGTIELNTMP